MRFSEGETKFIFVFSICLFAVGVFGNSFGSLVYGATVPSLYVGPTSYSASHVGETVPIQVVAYQVYNLVGFQFQLRFDPNLLRVLNASLGTLFPQPPYSTSSITFNNTQGTVSIQAQILGGRTPASNWGPLLSINFNATHGTKYPLANDKCNLTIGNDVLYGMGNQPITHVDQTGTYKAPYVPPLLGITLNTPDTKYYYDDTITINGTLTGNNYPIPNALVALEVENSIGLVVVARTIQTSILPVQCPLQITYLGPSQSDGTPQDSFAVGTIAYFTVTVNNPSSTRVSGLLSINPYDSSNSTLGVNSLPVTIPAGSTLTAILGFPLQYYNKYVLTPPTSGKAIAYASVWSDYLEEGGVPLAMESSASFTITGTPQGQPISTNPIAQGSYQDIISIHFSKGLYSSTLPPNYTITATAKFMGNTVSKTKQIQVTTAGDVNMDGQVSLQDLVALAAAFGSKLGDPKWNPNADINGDGKVNLSDLVLLGANYQKGAI